MKPLSQSTYLADFLMKTSGFSHLLLATLTCFQNIDINFYSTMLSMLEYMNNIVF